jgi:hypothetical protein
MNGITTRVRLGVSPPIAPVYSEPPKAVAASSSGRRPGDRDVCLASIRAPKGRQQADPNTNDAGGSIDTSFLTKYGVWSILRR